MSKRREILGHPCHRSRISGSIPRWLFACLCKGVASRCAIQFLFALSTRLLARLSTTACEEDPDLDECPHSGSSAKSEQMLLDRVLPSYTPWRGEKGCTEARQNCCCVYTVNHNTGEVTQRQHKTSAGALSSVNQLFQTET